MPKAIAKPITPRSLSKPNPDAELITKVRRHDLLWQTWPPEGGASKEHLDETCDLELQILATPAFTRQGLAGKRRVAERAAQFHDDECGQLLEEIMRNDAERVAAGKPSRKNGDVIGASAAG
jgi:hypothetical protein